MMNGLSDRIQARLYTLRGQLEESFDEVYVFFGVLAVSLVILSIGGTAASAELPAGTYLKIDPSRLVVVDPIEPPPLDCDATPDTLVAEVKVIDA